MEGESPSSPELMDLGAVSTETRGGVGQPIDEKQQFLGGGLTDD